MRLCAVVQVKLDGPSNRLIELTRKHVAACFDILTDHIIANKDVATIVKQEVWCSLMQYCNVPHTAYVLAVYTVTWLMVCFARLIVPCWMLCYAEPSEFCCQCR